MVQAILNRSAPHAFSADLSAKSERSISRSSNLNDQAVRIALSKRVSVSNAKLADLDELNKDAKSEKGVLGNSLLQLEDLSKKLRDLEKLKNESLPSSEQKLSIEIEESKVKSEVNRILKSDKFKKVASFTDQAATQLKEDRLNLVQPQDTAASFADKRTDLGDKFLGLLADGKSESINAINDQVGKLAQFSFEHYASLTSALDDLDSTISDITKLLDGASPSSSSFDNPEQAAKPKQTSEQLAVSLANKIKLDRSSGVNAISQLHSLDKAKLIY